MSNRLKLHERVARRVVLAVNFVSRRLGRGAGTVIGGRFGLHIAPGLLESLSRGRTIVLVSGTNGKTTTTSMVVAGWGGAVTTNQTGANMPAGHVAALSADVNERTVLEVDEAWLADVLEATHARVVILLNLSRDQLDRANEVRHMAERWCRALATQRDWPLSVVANANDPMIVYAARDTAHVLWCDVPTNWLADALSCPVCTAIVQFHGRDWWCACGFRRPNSMTTLLADTLQIGGDEVALDLAVPGDFNRANAAMALSALYELGEPLALAVQGVNALQSVAGRFSLRHWRGRDVRLLLAKNPAGFSAMLSTVPTDNSEVWVAINARVADGRDPSWLYDIDFESLRGHHVRCLGDRRLDIATRLDYAGVGVDVVDDELELLTDQSSVLLLANYTAFAEWMARSQP